MALPTPSKTWEYKTNWFVYGGDTSDELAVAIMADVKDLLCDYMPRVGAYAEGSFTTDAGDQLYTAPSARFDPAIIGNVVGKSVHIVGATSAGNNGTFTITAQTSTTLKWVNASKVDEALAGHLRIFAGDFTNPWEIDCTGQSTSHGSVADGIDRIANDRTRMGVGGTSNCGFWTLKNSVTNTYWSYSTRSSTATAGDRAAHGVLRSTSAPFEMLVPPNLNSAPQGPLLTDGVSRAHFEHNAESSWLLYDWATAGPAWFINVMMSSDGQQTRVFFCSGGYIQSCWIDGLVLNPVSEWSGAGIPTPTFTAMVTSGGATANGCEYTYWNDAAKVASSKMPWNLPGLSNQGDLFAWASSFYCTSEGAGSAASGQNLAAANELTGEYELYPIGLWSSSYGLEGRHGEIPDLWWHPTGLTNGNTFPANTTRTFLCLDNLVVPWNGDILEMA